MKYHNITKDDMLNGEGLRVVLWVSGCSHNCPGCHNPQTHNPNSGIEFDDAALQEIREQLSQNYISGITFSGGDPLNENNREKIEYLIKLIRTEFPSKNIWLYSGYTWEQVLKIPSLYEIISLVDVFCDGRFVLEQKNENKPWVGSDNQRVIDVPSTIKAKKVVLK